MRIGILTLGLAALALLGAQAQERPRVSATPTASKAAVSEAGRIPHPVPKPLIARQRQEVQVRQPMQADRARGHKKKQ